MQHFTTLISKNPSDHSRAIILMSHHNRNKPKNIIKNPNEPRKTSQHGTKSYHDALQRAFNNAKAQIFFNPDMQYFITLTYRGTTHNSQDVLTDVKRFIQTEKRNSTSKKNYKYIYVLEYQKRGSIHVHMIANNNFTTHKNKNGYDSLTYWRQGFSSVLHIKNFDKNFKPYLYLFKYMKKTERIGKSFIHSSRNLNNFQKLPGNPLQLHEYTELTREYSQTQIYDKKLHFYRYFLEKYDIVTSHQITKGEKPCQSSNHTKIKL